MAPPLSPHFLSLTTSMLFPATQFSSLLSFRPTSPAYRFVEASVVALLLHFSCSLRYFNCVLRYDRHALVALLHSNPSDFTLSVFILSRNRPARLAQLIRTSIMRLRSYFGRPFVPNSAGRCALSFITFTFRTFSHTLWLLLSHDHHQKPLQAHLTSIFAD